MGLRTNPTDVLPIAPASMFPCEDSFTSAELDDRSGPGESSAVEEVERGDIGIAKYGMDDSLVRIVDKL